MYSFLVTATDPTDGKDVIRVNVMVDDVNEAPSITSAGATAITHPENETVLDIDLTNQPDADAAEYTATDPDMVPQVDAEPGAALQADRLTWSTAGPDGSKFSITPPSEGARTATLAFKSAPNFEAMADADGNNMYEVTVVITDSQANTGTRDVTITLTNVEEDGSVMFSLLHPQVGTQLAAMASDS